MNRLHTLDRSGEVNARREHTVRSISICLANDASISSDAQLAARLRQPGTLLLTEWFKIEHGVIQHIEAIMQNLPHGSKSGWDK